MPDTIYSTKVSATGGRHGSIRSDDGLLNLKLALPRTLGGNGEATNPEQLFAVTSMPRALRTRSST
jgi:osmotically inducible protein OsmC